MAGRVVLGINACQKGDIVSVAKVMYQATGQRTSSGYWEALYYEKSKKKRRRNG